MYIILYSFVIWALLVLLVRFNSIWVLKKNNQHDIDYKYFSMFDQKKNRNIFQCFKIKKLSHMTELLKLFPRLYYIISYFTKSSLWVKFCYQLSNLKRNKKWVVSRVIVNFIIHNSSNCESIFHIIENINFVIVLYYIQCYLVDIINTYLRNFYKKKQTNIS